MGCWWRGHRRGKGKGGGGKDDIRCRRVGVLNDEVAKRATEVEGLENRVGITVIKRWMISFVKSRMVGDR